MTVSLALEIFSAASQSTDRLLPAGALMRIAYRSCLPPIALRVQTP